MKFAWYSHYMGDYARDTAHLSLVEHGAYRLLLDHYYSTGAPLPNDIPALYRICRAFEESERKAVDTVLAGFFELRRDGYHNRRADVELVKRAEHHERLSSGARKTNAKRWANRSATRSAVASPQPQPHSQPESKAKEENLAAKTAPPVDARHRPVFDSCYELYRERFRKSPAWGAREGKTLERFLREQPGMPAEEIVRRYRHQLASTGRYHREKHGSLVHLLSNFDVFADGPVLDNSPKGAINEKSVKRGFDPVATAAALGFGKQTLPD